MIVYLETSALLQLYVDEPGQAVVRDALDRASIVAVHLVGYAEIRAAFAWQRRMLRVSSAALVRMRELLERDWEGFEVLAADAPLVRRAGDLAETFALRGFDSLHLAAAESLLAAEGVASLLFLSADRKLNRAAHALGMLVEPRLA